MNERDALVGAVTLAALGGALFTGRSEPVWVILGAGLIGAGAEASARRSWRGGLVGAAIAGLGGWIVADVAAREDVTPVWMKVVTIAVAVAVAGGVGAGSVAASGAASLSPMVVYAAVIVTAGGIWACVPETDGPGRGLAVVVVVAAAGLALRRPVVPGVFGAVLGLMIYAGLEGGQYRSSAVIGMAGCFGLFLLVGGLPVLSRGLERNASVAILGAHVIAVGLASRVAGRGDGVTRSVLIEAVVLAGLGAVLVIVTRSNRERVS